VRVLPRWIQVRNHFIGGYEAEDMEKEREYGVTKKALMPPDISARKGELPIVCLTAYTTPIALLVDRHCDVVLVGDSVGMALHGLRSTLGVTLDMMILHGKAVRRGIDRALSWWLSCPLEHMRKAETKHFGVPHE
jgi:ketopantoate hydroxymethyltransferase